MMFGIPFVDTGMNLRIHEDSLNGQLRLTSSIDPYRAKAFGELPIAAPKREDIYGWGRSSGRHECVQRSTGGDEVEEARWILFR